ncbi:hypothetical protein HMPREF0083_04157 [Aneurinibacillus aneurinilyticus ATCC 12856]|uniref:Holin-like toxin n=1 Tax=Aneurinibacillus aneurinilyticus ATCC 12856 TaxID=649747 RepID=U1YA88_ANEAE|nr:hypothetical protein HMPREF0083_04157 [Aneurinibacillus aneurinilyticus ATCC 12856]
MLIICILGNSWYTVRRGCIEQGVNEMEMENIMQGVTIFTLLVLTFVITIIVSKRKNKKNRK